MVGIIVAYQSCGGNYCSILKLWWELLQHIKVVVGIIVKYLIFGGNYCSISQLWWELLQHIKVVVGIIVAYQSCSGNYCNIFKFWWELLQLFKAIEGLIVRVVNFLEINDLIVLIFQSHHQLMDLSHVLGIITLKQFRSSHYRIFNQMMGVPLFQYSINSRKLYTVHYTLYTDTTLRQYIIVLLYYVLSLKNNDTF